MLLTCAPSIQASSTSAPVAAAAAAARSVGTSQGTPGFVGSQSPTADPKIQLCTGMKMDFPVGTVTLRSAEPPNVPPRNQTGPLWPTPANAPVVSCNGF